MSAGVGHEHAQGIPDESKPAESCVFGMGYIFDSNDGFLVASCAYRGSLLAESAHQHHASGAAEGHSPARAQVIGGRLKAI